MPGTLTLTGTDTHPILEARFGYADTHPQDGVLLREWVREHCRGYWNKSGKYWKLTSLPANPNQVFAKAGFDFDIDLDDLAHPYVALSETQTTLRVFPRLTNYVALQHQIGWGGVWDKKDRVFQLSPTDIELFTRIVPKKTVNQIRSSFPTLTPDPDGVVAKMSTALGVKPEREQFYRNQFPDWWNRELFPFQLPGCHAVVRGHTLLADQPGLGKTSQAIAAVALWGCQRVVVVCPPVLAMNWEREFLACGWPLPVVRVDPKTDTTTTGGCVPETGVVIVPDSLLPRRENLRKQLGHWEPEVMIVDEAHRLKTFTSQRTQAVLEVAQSVPDWRKIAITGTPVLSSPHELIPILEYTGHLMGVFGGAHKFLKQFCTRPPFGGFRPRKSALAKLSSLLFAHVWVRREKSLVLPQLPQKFHTELEVVVDTSEYQQAHRDVMEQVREWVETVIDQTGDVPDAEMVESFCDQSLPLLSRLRVGSALTKIDAACEFVQERLRDCPDDPFIVWIHHREPALAFAERLADCDIECELLTGGMSDRERQEIVDRFQAGDVRVLIASITAAGVGLTLTRGKDMLFLETDWTPAMLTQAIDRCHRIGQKRPVVATTMVAYDTLDEHVQKILRSKGDTVNAVHGDDSSTVAVSQRSRLKRPQDILRILVEEVLAEIV